MKQQKKDIYNIKKEKEKETYNKEIIFKKVLGKKIF